MKRIKQLGFLVVLVLLVLMLSACGCKHVTVIDPAVAATCTENGLTAGAHCSECGETLAQQETVPANGHTETVKEGKAATCTEDGLTEGKYCSACNKVLTEQEVIKASGHIEVVDAAVAATCSETGLTEGKHCSVCGEVLAAQETIPALEHTVAITEGKAATCTETGLTDGKYCTVCGEVLAEQEIIPASHTEATKKGKAATCTATGLTDGKYCKVCDEVLAEQETIPALGHTTNSGICSRCGKDMRIQPAIELMNDGKYIEASEILAKYSEDAEAKELLRQCGTGAIREFFKEKGKNDGTGTYHLSFSSRTGEEIIAEYFASKDQIALKRFYEGIVEGYIGLVYTPTTGAVTFAREAVVDDGSLWGYNYQGGVLLAHAYTGTYTQRYGSLEIPGMMVFEEDYAGILSPTTDFKKETVEELNELLDVMLEALVDYGFCGTMRDLGLTAYNP